VRDYYTTLKGIQVALLDQTSALEEAGILPPEQGRQDAQEGMGSFDVAWLNSRSKDVGCEKERELVAKAKAWLERTEAHKKDASDKMEE